MIGGQRYAFIRSDAAVLGPRFKFTRHGQNGTEIAEILPHFGKIVDDVCLIHSMHTDQFNHAPAQLFINTGAARPGRPSLGSWVVYGLGSQASDLPAFVVMSTGSGISGGAANWSSGFLPTVYSGVRFRNHGDPILNVSRPAGSRAPACSATPSISCGRSIAAGSTSSAIPKLPRGSRRTKWPTGWRRRLPS